jgi:hypothetical protein
MCLISTTWGSCFRSNSNFRRPKQMGFWHSFGTGYGGPLWQPLCYAQIGGLAVATFITLLLVPVLYSITVLDLKIVKWELKPKET